GRRRLGGPRHERRRRRCHRSGEMVRTAPPVSEGPMRIDSKLCVLALAAAGLVACGGPESFSIDLVTDDNCNNLVDLIQAGHRVKLTVSGPGMSPIVVEADGASGGLEIPDVPAGKDRVVTVEVREPNGDLYSLGESKPFEVKEDGTEAVRV